MDDQTKAGAGKVTKAQRSTTTEAGTSRIDLKIPGRPDYGGVVRLTAAAVAGRMGLSYDDIEDLKVAGGEAGAAPALAAAPHATVGVLLARGRVGGPIGPPPPQRAPSRRN